MFDGPILPVTEPIAERWGILAGQWKLKGKDLKMADGFIAATALHHNLTIVTRNVKDCSGLEVRIFNPWKQAGA